MIGTVSLLWSADPITTLLYVASCAEGLLAFAMMLTFLRDVRPASYMPFLQAWLVLLVIPGILLWCHVPGFQPPATLDPSTGDYISFFVRFSHPFIGRSNNLAALLLLLVPPIVAWALRTRRWPDIAVAVAGGGGLPADDQPGCVRRSRGRRGLYFLLRRRTRRAVLRALLWSLAVRGHCRAGRRAEPPDPSVRGQPVQQ